MKICSEFKCESVKVAKMKNYGIIVPKEDVGKIYCCIPLVECMEIVIRDLKGTITGEYEILYREVLPRGKTGVIRFPKEYMSCDILLIR